MARAKIPKENEVFPCFQPIVAVETQSIYGYEVLGRINNSEGKYQSVTSLGSFFHDPEVPDGEKIKIDRAIREKAIKVLSQQDTVFFFNIKPEWIYRYNDRVAEIPTLKLLRKYAINPSKVVIEITEESFSDIVLLAETVQEYRRVGCQIAIDDVGNGFINFDRIAYLRPDILKLDLKIIKKSVVSGQFRDVVEAFAIFAEKIGASLLFEGIERKEELKIALLLGSRYLQGFLFAEAKELLMQPGTFSLMLRSEISRYVNEEFRRRNKEFQLCNTLNHILSEIIGVNNNNLEITKILQVLPGACFRIYLCNREGKQVSSNFTKSKEGRWQEEPEFKGRNWIWRPYFIRNFLESIYIKKGMLSEPYLDLHSHEKVQTFSYPLDDELILFIDILEMQNNIFSKTFFPKPLTTKRTSANISLR